jgi:hypothetical protein
MAALSWQFKSTPFGAAALMRLNVRLWHGALPIPNVGSSVANGGESGQDMLNASSSHFDPGCVKTSCFM